MQDNNREYEEEFLLEQGLSYRTVAESTVLAVLEWQLFFHLCCVWIKQALHVIGGLTRKILMPGRTKIFMQYAKAVLSINFRLLSEQEYSEMV